MVLHHQLHLLPGRQINPEYSGIRVSILVLISVESNIVQHTLCYLCQLLERLHAFNDADKYSSSQSQ